MRWQILAAPMMILMMVVTYVNFYKWNDEAYDEFMQRQMDLQVNYSVDAATQDLLEFSTSLDTDIAGWGSMTLDPHIALQTYQGVLLRNFGMVDTEMHRRDVIEKYSPVFMVTTNDGYYLYTRRHNINKMELKDGTVVPNTEYDFVWSPKIPYSEVDGNKVYMYNLDAKYYVTIDVKDTVSGTLNSIDDSNKLLDIEGPGGINEAKMVIADTITEAFNKAVFTNMEGKVSKFIYIPAVSSQWTQTNAINSPTVLAYVTNSDASRANANTFGIGGAKIDTANFVLAYVVNGEKKYYPSEYRDKIEEFYHGRDDDLEIMRMYTSDIIAAQRGYYYDIFFESSVLNRR